MELLSPSDLELPWKKLYLTYERLQFNRDEWHGMLHIPDSLGGNLALAVGACRCYFSPGLSLLRFYTNYNSKLNSQPIFLSSRIYSRNAGHLASDALSKCSVHEKSMLGNSRLID